MREDKKARVTLMTQLSGGGRLAFVVELREEVEELALDGANVD
jgi:hypothetical protein